MSDFALLDDLTLACGKTVAVERLSLGIRKGERVVLLGPSGCGKTTTMRAIAGLLAPRPGTIRLDGSDVTRVPPSRRGLGLVFQSYALSPHLTVHENVASAFAAIPISRRGCVRASQQSGSRTLRKERPPSFPAVGSCASPRRGRSSWNRSFRFRTNRSRISMPGFDGRCASS